MSLLTLRDVSIPSRGFWFFEGPACGGRMGEGIRIRFQSPRGDFGFLKATLVSIERKKSISKFQSPRGDFGFLKWLEQVLLSAAQRYMFQSPRGDFGFLKFSYSRLRTNQYTFKSFNPLAGILVF